MSRKIIVSVLLLLSVVMFGLTILFYSKSDRVAPQIQFVQEEFSYSPGDNEAKLLEGVNAIDNKDGDLSDKVFIEKIVPAIDGVTATVTYVVVDSSNNVAKVARNISYSGKGGKEAGETERGTEDKTEESTESSGSGVTEGEKESDKESEKKTEDESETEDRTPREDGSPSIFLNTKKAAVEYGTEIDYMSYIDDIVDDKDGLEIWRSISIDGRGEAVERGTHTLSYYVTDSDGNMSDIVKLELTVK